MLEKIKNNYIYILTFLFFVVLLALSPICGDDWGNYPIGAQGLQAVFLAAKNAYFTWEGRFVSRIFIYLFTYYKFLFVIVTSCLFTLIVYVSNKIIGDTKNKVVYVIPFMLLLLLNTASISQTYTWVAGSITYLYPTAIVFFYFYYLFQKNDFKFGKFEFIILLIINIITPMFVENIGLAFVFGNILLLVLNRKSNKKELIKFGVLSLFSAIALIIMLISPGSGVRTGTEAVFYDMNFFERIFFNIPHLVSYGININIIVFIMMTLAIIYMLKKKKVKMYLIILFSIIPILGIIQHIHLMFPFSFKSVNFSNFVSMWGLFQVDNWYFIFYWTLFVILFFYSIIYFATDKRERLFLISITLIGGVAIASMLVVPVWGERVAILSEIIFLMVSIRLLKNCFNPKFNKIIYAFLVILIVYFLTMFILIFIIQKERDDYINLQLKENKQEIEVYEHFINYIWVGMPLGDFNARVFKDYYGIPQEKTLKIINSKLEQFLYDTF